MSNLQNYINECIDPNFRDYKFSNDIIVTPFWRKDFCARMLNECKNNSQHFHNDPNPYYMTEEINLFNLDRVLFNCFSQHYQKHLIPFLENFWRIGSEIEGISSAYFIRYTQTSERKHINIHTDRGEFSVYFKLNSDYGEGTLHFPRQNWDSRDVDVGHAIIWPSRLTHPHYSDDISWGEKYSFVCFNYENDTPIEMKIPFDDDVR